MKPNADALSKTKRFLLVKNKNYAEFIVKLVNVGIVNLVHSKTEESIGMFGVPKDGVSKKRLILDARRANQLFLNTKCRKCLTRGCSHSYKTITLGRTIYRQVVHRQFGPSLSAIITYTDRFWSHPSTKKWKEDLVKIAFSTDSMVSLSRYLKIYTSWGTLRCFWCCHVIKSWNERKNEIRGQIRRLGRYIDDLFVVLTNRDKFIRFFDRVWSAFTCKRLPPKKE